MIALLTALESATGPDRELDAEIAKAIGFIPDGPGEGTSSPWAWGPDYTADLNAALTLCGDAFEWLAKRHNDDRGTHWIAQVGTRHFNGKTPAIAVCTAAVHHMMETGGKVGVA